MRVLVDAPWFTKAITAVILINAVTLGAETSPELLASFGDALHLIDRLALAAFVVELLLRFGAYGKSFFRDPWNWFYTIVVAITLLPAAWSEVARQVMVQKPFAWIFFVGYLVVTSFTVLNLFIAVAVTAMQNQMTEEHAEHDREEMAATMEILAEVRRLRADVEALRGKASV